MKAFQFLLLAVLTVFLFYTVMDMPPRGDLDAPASQIVSPADSQVAGAYYIKYAYKDTHTPNMVCVVLADYRSVDTLGEVVVVFAGVMTCFFILRRRP
ncbi:hydrogen gas-evolving membrane-bound hydrogenase subunit E [Desulfonatronospira sp.]|uniref:hydrogen gas-evolving membrane-bound hydrogenase subunit E n=1 Tax=Desulfonatronospira sp. TaxID=1962951 RepID=UPI0025C02303|nr:hydrogen gas-evolving membrane-bound hydrogenase subunit E [Desulfonatronospira sp.]